MTNFMQKEVCPNVNDGRGHIMHNTCCHEQCCIQNQFVYFWVISDCKSKMVDRTFVQLPLPWQQEGRTSPVAMITNFLSALEKEAI